MRTGHVAFRTDTEEFAFHGVDFVGRGKLIRKDGVERFDEMLPRGHAVGGQVFIAVGNPHVDHAGGSECAPDVRPDGAATAGVLDPEFADGFVAMREGEAVRRFGVGEAGRIEVHPEAERLGPVDPRLEMTGLDLVAVDFFAAGLEVEGMEVEPVLAGDEGENLFEVRAQFVRRAGAAGIIAGHGKAAAGIAGRGGLESADIIALPAVDGDRGAGEGFEGFLGVHAERRVGFARYLVGRGHG